MPETGEIAVGGVAFELISGVGFELRERLRRGVVLRLEIFEFDERGMTDLRSTVKLRMERDVGVAAVRLEFVTDEIRTVSDEEERPERGLHHALALDFVAHFEILRDDVAVGVPLPHQRKVGDAVHDFLKSVHAAQYIKKRFAGPW